MPEKMNNLQTMKHYFYHGLRGHSSKLVRRVANIKLDPQNVGGKGDKN